MAPRSRLTRELQSLLHGQRIAALGTLDANGRAAVSMVPYAVDTTHRCLVIHVSALAAHTGYMRASPEVSLMVMRPEVAGEPVHALPRATLAGRAEMLASPGSLQDACRATYLARFPEAEFMTQLGDFMFVAIHPKSARQVAGFGAARNVEARELKRVLGPVGKID